eukprot:130879_1
MGCCCGTSKTDDDSDMHMKRRIQTEDDHQPLLQIKTKNNKDTNYLSITPSSTAKSLFINTIVDNMEDIIDEEFRQITHHLIYGFLRDLIYTSNIGDLIIYLIQAYYGFGYEPIDVHWDPHLLGSSLQLSKNMKTLTNICRHFGWSGSKGNWRTGYSSYIIDVNPGQNLEIIAEFLIVACATPDSIYIGIELENWKSKNTNFAKNVSAEGYAYCTTQRQHSTFAHEYIQTDTQRWDTIYMKLKFLSDSEFGELYFKKNKCEWINSCYKINKQKKKQK